MSKLKRKFISSIDEWSQEVPLSVLGQTGSGKSSKVLEYINSRHLNSAVLVSVDSIAAYEGLDIGSSKARGKDRSKHTWLGLDLVSPAHKMTAAIFRNQIVDDLKKYPQRPLIFLGGTHFYERYLLEGPAAGKESDPNFISQLEKEGAPQVLEKLIAQDIRWKSKLHAGDKFRVYRYADLVFRQGLDFDVISEGGEPLFPEVETLVVDLPSDEQESRLRHRIDGMFSEGWVAEVERLLLQFEANAPGLQTMGYVDIISYLKNPTTESELKEKIYIKHRQLAKVQRTWLRKLKAS